MEDKISKHPKPPIKQKLVKTPEDLLQLWREYSNHVESTPDKEEVVTVKGDVVIRNIKRPLLRQGFESFVYNNYGFHIHQYIDNPGNRYEAYVGVVTHIRAEWQNDQLSGTLTGRYKAPNLVARLTGLADKQDVTHDGGIQITIKEA